MGVKIADKLEQFNNGTYYLVDSSAVEYVDKDGNTKSVKDALDNGTTGSIDSDFKTVAFTDNIDMGKYHLLAKITDVQYESHNIIRFSCNNFKGVNEAGYRYEDDVDTYRFDIHFNTGYKDLNSGNGTTLKQHGLTLYSYPLNNPQNTSPEIKEAVRLYWDYTNNEIYVFFVDIMTSIPHCVVEYTGSGTLKEENCFVNDNTNNTFAGTAAKWANSNWKSIPYDKLETPPIYELGGELGGKVYTTLAELGLTAPVSIGEAFNAMPDKSTLMLNVNNASNADATVTDAPHNQGVLVINKHNNGRFSIEFNYSLGSNGNTIRKWIGTLKGSDGTGLNWKEVAYLNDHAMKSYSSLADLELDTTATINDIVGKMANNSMFVYKADVFDLTQYENLQFATVTIIKQSANRVQAIMTDKDTGNLYIGKSDSSNQIVGWTKTNSNAKVLVTNAQNFKLDITKKNASWYGFFKLEYLYGNVLSEVCVGISNTLSYTVTKGKNCIDKITYTINGANIVLGIDFTSKVYGVQVIEMPSEFGTINSLTAEAFTGNTVASQTGVDLELYPQTKVVTSLNKGTWQVGQRIKQKTDFTATTDDANFEIVAKNMSSGTSKFQTVQLYQLTPIANGTNASVSLNVYENGTAQTTIWPHTNDMVRNDYNIACEGFVNNGGTFNNKLVKSVTIDLSDSSLQSSLSNVQSVVLSAIPTGANVIRVEGYYTPPEGTYYSEVFVTAGQQTSSAVGVIYKAGGGLYFLTIAGSTASKGSGFAKIYYVD